MPESSTYGVSADRGSLRQEHLHLAQVAGAVGYDSESSFSRAFKAEFGMTPGQWRERFAVRRAGGVAGDAAAK
jgi:AraC-like DNA-binding protein